MSGSKRFGRTAARLGAAQRALLPGKPATAPNETDSDFTDPLLWGKYQVAIRRHLGAILDKLFADITSLHFHIAWAGSLTHPWAELTLPTGCSVCRRISGAALRPGCRICGPRQLGHALGGGGEGLHFTCRLGVRNYWLPILVRGATLGIAYLQTLDQRRRKVAAKSSAKAAGVVVTSVAFGRAARLLHFVVEYAQTASLAELRKDELLNAGRIVVALEKEQARLHEALHRHLPVAGAAVRRSGPESHPDELVHRLLDCIQCDYARPLTLRQCAKQLGMNAAYLSDLFSHAVGVPFKTYLTNLRLEKAKALLGDGRKNLCEVAGAVGYASEDRFRIAFKSATGLSPKLWRETMQANPPSA